MPDKPEPPAADMGGEAEPDEPLQGASFPVVGIGASAGGLEAFTQLLKALPPDTGMAFVLVQHLSPAHESALAEILSRATRMPVMEVRDEGEVQPNHVYVIPPNRCMGIAGGNLQLAPREKAGNLRVIDHFFRALAEDRRHQAIGVVLSGTASDGTLGLEAIKAEGGITFAQDDTAQHEGMPHSAIASGCVDLVLPPGEIARELVRIASHPHAVRDSGARERESEAKLAPVLGLLHRATGVDFSQYKFNTLYRRVTRRMVLQKMTDLRAYAEFVQRNPEEIGALYRDILIGVTSFFRNPEAFEALKEKVFPRLLENRARHEAVRIWTLGCSTGQEAYSVAMAFAEVAETQGSQVALQLFATDLSAAGVDTARAGVYPKDIALDVSPERLRRFFVEVDGYYRIVKSIRDSCVFSRHNVLADPPFSRLDLVTCRNLLIYLEPAVQQKIVPTLHYALKPSGFLWLGTSETIGSFRNLFEPLDAKQKIYAKKPGPHGAHLPLQHVAATRAPFIPLAARAASPAPELHREAERLLLTRFAPPSVLVSADLDILQCRGDTGPYLSPAPGKASLALPKMLREGLLVGVRAALARAGQAGKPTREEGLRVKADGRWREVAVEVIPLKSSDGKDADGKDAGFLVLFHEPAQLATPPEAVVDRTAAASAEARTQADPDNTRLTNELAATREYLQSVIEQQEAANEELQSSNEEIQSANEELQSVNEELETSKEEIQSSNEELATVNDELNNRNTELNRLSNDLVNVLASVQMPIVLVGNDLRVRRFTPAAQQQLNLLPGDIGRPLAHIKLGLDGLRDLEPLLGEVLDTVSNRELDVRDQRGVRYALRLRPYRTLDNRIDGVVMMLVDVDLLKRANEHTEAIVATVREPLLVLDAELRVETASASFYRNFGVARDETVGRLVYELGNGQWNIPELRRMLGEVVPGDKQFNDYEVQQEFEHMGKRTMLLNARRLLQLDDRSPGILLAIEDVTESKLSDDALRENQQRLQFTLHAANAGDWDLDLVTGKARCSFRHDQCFGATEPIPDWSYDKFLTYVHPDDRAREDQNFRAAVASGRDWNIHCRVIWPEGSVHWIESFGMNSRYVDGKPTRMLGMVRDITERMRAEEALRQSVAELAEADRRKNEFLATLAHELRNPLAPIRHGLQIVRLTRGTGEAAQAASEMMERQVAQMVRLVDDLLDVSRITRGRIELRLAPVELMSVVRDAVETARPVCASKAIELIVALPPQAIHLSADATRLIQVLGNLLNNACKFTDKGGRVSLAVERDGGEAVIRVSDTGIGIAAEQIPRIFDMFTQVDTSLERSASGLGIGLTLVRTLVELHGGTVQAHSAGVGQGSEFVVRLPIAAERVPPGPAQPKVGSPATSVGRRVLVVDDNRDAADALARMLQLSGHDTRLAHDGIEAAQAAAAFRPDVVLLDIALPKLNGYDAARRMRDQPGGKEMLLVALTGMGNHDDRQKSIQAGFDRHIVKPVDYDALIKLLADLPAPHEPQSR